MQILTTLTEIGSFVAKQIIHAWPLFVITIPLAAAIRLSGVGEKLGGIMRKKPIIAVILATLVGALSPLCSCSVIPVVTGLLISGVPLAPVMSFWLASPSMDPEIFFLSVSTLGWQLATWRLAATFIMSLGAGLITILIEKHGWLQGKVLRRNIGTPSTTTSSNTPTPVALHGTPSTQPLPATHSAFTPLAVETVSVPVEPSSAGCGCNTSGSTSQKIHLGASASALTRFRVTYLNPTFLRQLGKESLDILLWLGKFMLLAFVLEAIITLYLPQEWITGPLGNDSPFAILIGLGLGLPLYTSTLAALGIVGGLLAKGMSGAAALAFLIAGATTTIPAMTAVWGVATRRVFGLYIGFTAVSALVTGLLFQVIG